jgi:hypothetical protein
MRYSERDVNMRSVRAHQLLRLSLVCAALTWLFSALAHEVVDHDAEEAVGAAHDERRPLRGSQPGVDAREHALCCGFLVAGRAVDLSSEEEALCEKTSARAGLGRQNVGRTEMRFVSSVAVCSVSARRTIWTSVARTLKLPRVDVVVLDAIRRLHNDRVFQPGHRTQERGLYFFGQTARQSGRVYQV